MITFDDVKIGPNLYQLKELTFNEALKVSVIQKDLNEKRITEFLRNVLVSDQDPLKMFVQERYAILLKYLEKQTNTLLSINIDMQQYLPKLNTDWLPEISVKGAVVRQMSGFEAEYLESKCKSVAEWIACAMAIQLKYDKHEKLDAFPDPEENDFEIHFLERLEYLKSLPQSEFEQHYQVYADLNDLLCTVVDLAVNDQGFVVRGTDDAPLRFCPSAAFIGFVKDVDELRYGNSIQTQ
ncbi:hypothetical protein GCM10023206_06660 [Acinetobacter puyangensis]|uniref:Uncharacterized protein n=1 Tax=Acinetobacter puyangensis TaxID=1096779 RepID=A0A240E8L8_9GAMM|nr:hypothetical protein [Acinetobacter puyangensis]SNX44255.1 hypothetical protein SAMN05421731_102416 [Acinetobacter puyangensis]